VSVDVAELVRLRVRHPADGDVAAAVDTAVGLL
jgi:hypothetical protein